jgi:imidazoleglycerol-phosphate dehydratase / histidinol-phosphatase
MKKALFIDRDGTLLREPADEQIDAFEKMDFLPGVMRNLGFIRNKLDFEFVMVSNQDGLGTSSFPEDTFWPVQNLMLKILAGEGITFDATFIDRSFPADQLPTRKPGTAMLTSYMQGDYDLDGSYVIGDRETDARLAHG